MVMLRCLVVLGAALARSDARRDGLPRHKLDAVTSALAKGDYLVHETLPFLVAGVRARRLPGGRVL